MIELAVAAAVFVGFHLVPSSPVRGWTVARVGEPAYLAVFSVISLASIIWLVIAFYDVRAARRFGILGRLGCGSRRS